jgi:GTP 3',8-cyclase
VRYKQAKAMRITLPVVAPLTDSFAREISYLRVSLTDRCNYRCTYCMPEDGVELLPRDEILSFEEITRLAGIFASLGVRRIRLTGGEPTIRKRVWELVAQLAAVDGIQSVVMTTNGHLLADLAAPLAGAGLRQVNVSLDTLDPAKFRAITRRGDIQRVVAGIDAARAAGLGVKINAVALRGFNDGEITSLCRFAWDRDITPRFIEQMPLSEGRLFLPGRHLAASVIRRTIEGDLGQPLEPVPSAGPGDRGPARYWRLARDPRCEVGIISALTEHFCDTCNRLRLTAVGDLHTCLGYDDATGLRGPLRAGLADDGLRDLIRGAVLGKRLGHSFEDSGGGAPSKHMVSIGG